VRLEMGPASTMKGSTCVVSTAFFVGSPSGRGEGVGINAQHTIQCESFGNPSTAAGPKARAVFMAAPVNGTANLKFG